MKVIVGLGNPGTEYARTRHNAGFMAVQGLAERHEHSAAKHKFHAGVIEGHIKGARCVLMQPMTYVNRSGLAVGEAVRFYKIDPAADLLIVSDDVALPCGRLRLRESGSAGGHNGLADIERVLGHRQYPRLRIGIDPPGRIVQRNYVLGRFTPEQQAVIDATLNTVCDAIECWIESGMATAMNRYNRAE